MPSAEILSGQEADGFRNALLRIYNSRRSFEAIVIAIERKYAAASSVLSLEDSKKIDAIGNFMDMLLEGLRRMDECRCVREYR